MMYSNSMNPGIDDLDVFGAVLNCAVRYCIGRTTYMPGLVTAWIMRNCHGVLTRKTIGVMIRDIDEAAARDGLGMECDKLTWERFREWLREEGEAGWQNSLTDGYSCRA